MKNFFIILFSLFSLLVIFPKNIFAMAAPAAVACVKTGGNYQIINNVDGSQSGTCVYFGGVQCTDYEAYQQSGHCNSNYLFFGSLHFWPTRVIYLFIVGFIVYKIAKSRWEK
ncbi:MAG TPA: DUF333 domain-containing protein [Alphaproteobacteria bacterium]|jgi:hypothetical protein|nr:DUF333 domain-containing protein [Alphaproteobacteria bacterium]